MFTFSADYSFDDYNKGFSITTDLGNQTNLQELEQALSVKWCSLVETADLGWLEVVPEQFDRCYKLMHLYSSKTSMKCRYVEGGSMPNPSTFVYHWQMRAGDLIFHLEHDKVQIAIEHQISSLVCEKLEIPYAGVKDTIIVKIAGSEWHFFFSVKHSPLLLHKTSKQLKREMIEDGKRVIEIDGVSRVEIGKTCTIHVCMDNKCQEEASETTTTTTAAANKYDMLPNSDEEQVSTDDEFDFENVDESNLYDYEDGNDIFNDILESDEDEVTPPKVVFSEGFEVVSRLKKIGFSLVYCGVQTKKSSPNITSCDLFKTFDQTYAWKCLLSAGYMIQDSLNCYILHQMRTCQPSADVLFRMANRSETCLFFNFRKELEDATMHVSGIQTSTPDEVELPPFYIMMRRIVVTPTKEIYLIPEPMVQNRIVRQYRTDQFIRIIFRDEDFCRISSAQSSDLDLVMKEFVKRMNTGFNIGNRHYDFLGCSNSQLREHGAWFFSEYDGITARSIREKAGELSSLRCISKYVSRLGLCFSASRGTVEVSTEEGCVSFIDDTENKGFCFTDGIGKISQSLAKKVSLFLFSSKIFSIRVNNVYDIAMHLA